MKRLLLSILLLICAYACGFAQWEEDVLGKGFEQMTIVMPDDYEGEVVCALVRSRPAMATNKAVLYIHGFNDYFFQAEQAQAYNRFGYAFFAVDLRKYGRAYLEHQRRGNMADLSEYYADIDTCLKIIQSDYYDTIVLVGHSTGGLIAALYADDNKEDLRVDALILNSPFLDMNFGKFKESVGVPVVSFIGGVFPGIKIKSGESTLYGESLHKDYRGEWDYNLDWKPLNSIPVSFGWTKAISKGHKRVKKGLSIPVPILVMHSDKSVFGDEWSELFTNADAVLDVKDIHRYAPNLGNNVSVAVIKDGLHDLVLSRESVRRSVYYFMFGWLEELFLP